MYYCKVCHEIVEVTEEGEQCEECGSDRTISFDDIYKRIENEEDFIIPQIMGLFAVTDNINSELPWYVPTIPILGYKSPNIAMEITLKMDSFTSPEITKKFLIDLKDKQGFGKIFQWTVCPKCSWDHSFQYIE